MADTDGQSEEEVDEMIRKLRPSLIRTVLSVTAVIVGIFGALTFIIYHALTCQPSFLRDGPDAGADAAPADEAQLVITELDWTLRQFPQAFTVADQTVVIRSTTPSGAEYFGTGFVISDGLVISAAHVVAHASAEATYPVYVHCAGQEVDGGIIAYDDVRDVMAIFAPGCDGTDLVIDPRWLSVNDELHVAGFMFGPGIASRYHRNTSPIPTAVLRVSDGPIEPELEVRVREMRRLRIPRFRAISGEAYPGNSGSPVFDHEGRVVGMLVIRDVLHGRGYMVPAVSIQHVLRANGLP